MWLHPTASRTLAAIGAPRMPRIYSTRSVQSSYDALWGRIAASDLRDCWPFLSRLQKSGYAVQIRIGGRPMYPHKAAYESTFGPVPDGFVLDHLCRNTMCCNPTHLQVVTQRINLMRGNGEAAKCAKNTHCKRGHELLGDNVTHRMNRWGNAERRCKQCAADLRHVYYTRFRLKHGLPTSKHVC